MWTPRRILMLLVGVAAFAGLFFGYGLFLGGVNGLPQLPEKYLAKAEGNFIAIRTTDRLPVETRLEQAFGPKCPELENPAYRTKIELRDRGIVFAAGPLPDFKEPTRKVRISPLSLAVFSKPSPNAKPDEVPEIVTLHADDAYLEYDKPVRSRTEILQGQAKLVGVELVANPEAPYRDLRKGRVIITTNQKSEDPGRWLIVRTPGPVYYQAADAGQPLPADVPTVRTSAAIEIENRDNLPRPLWGQRLFAVPSRGDDLHAGSAVADMLTGQRAPPPSATAIGLKMYFAPESTGPAKPGAKPQPGPNRLRRLEFGEQVQFNQWLDKSGGFPGSSPESARSAPSQEPPLAAAAAMGSAIGGVHLAGTLAESRLLTIETLGPFTYDLSTQLARFESAPAVPANQANNVEVVRSAASGVRDTLICKTLDIGFESRPLGSAAPATPKPGGQGGIKSLHATGPYVRLDAESEQLTALGTELKYLVDRPAGTSTMNFKGNPIDAVSKLNRLKTAIGIPTELAIVTTPGPPGPDRKPTRQTAIHVRGPGQIAMYDAAAKGTGLTATWNTQLTQAKELFGGRLLDKLTFDGGKIEDPKAGFDLSGDVIHAWIANMGAPGQSGTQAELFAMQSIRNVVVHSKDLNISDADSLMVWVKPVEKPTAMPAGPLPTMPGTAAGAAPAVPGSAPVALPAKPAPPPNPLNLSARTVEAWVSRSPKGPPARPGEAAPMRYDIDRAVCTDRVDGHQKPSDPTKPRGMDLRGAKLILDRHTIKDLAGFSADLSAAPGELAEFHYESLSLAGPKIVVDQLANLCRVTGAGALRMPAGQGFVGTRPNEQGVKPVAMQAPPGTSELTIEWADGMDFRGADGQAVFIGKVQAKQESAPAVGREMQPDAVWGQAFVLCHRLDVRFDRPVPFNGFRKDDKQPAPKIAQAICRPAPDDDASPGRVESFVLFEDEQRKRDRTVVKRQRVRAASLDLRGDAQRTLIAAGPGEMRLMQLGSRDARPGEPTPVGGATEMKLNVVSFRQRAQMQEKADRYQEAVFEGDVVAHQLPSDQFDYDVSRSITLPERSYVVEGEDSLTFSTYRPVNGRVEQKFDATGNARFRFDDYRGRGIRIVSDGKIVTLDGSPGRPAVVEQTGGAAAGRSAIPARRIEYDLTTKAIRIIDGSHGSITPR